MQAIKALVIGMGLLLLAGLALLGYGLYQKSTKRPAAAAVAEGPVIAFGTVPLALPPGARLVALQEASGRLAVLVDEGERQRVLVLDPVGGAVLGEFAPAAQR